MGNGGNQWLSAQTTRFPSIERGHAGDTDNQAMRRNKVQTAKPRMTTPAQPVTLREITADTVVPVINLSVAGSQTHLVAPNAVSLAEALFNPEAWYRAIYLGETPVGFVMLYDESLREVPPASPTVGVWRFMVAEAYQRQGIGKAAMRQVIEHVRRKGIFNQLTLSYVPADGSPEPFYRSIGFRNTDRVDHGERVMELPLGED